MKIVGLEEHFVTPEVLAAHMARNREAIPGIELATYIVEKGKPLLMRAASPPAH